MADKVSLTSQIAAVQSVASNDFTAWANKPTRELQQGHLRAAAETLRWVKANEADIRAYVAERRGKA